MEKELENLGFIKRQQAWYLELGTGGIAYKDGNISYNGAYEFDNIFREVRSPSELRLFIETVRFIIGEPHRLKIDESK